MNQLSEQFNNSFKHACMQTVIGHHTTNLSKYFWQTDSKELSQGMNQILHFYT